MKRAWALVTAALACVSVAAADAASEGWRVLESKRGITVSVKHEDGRALPRFRGQGVIEGEVLYVLAAVLDVPGAMEWAEGADETAVLREIDARTHLIYTHTDTPWPVADRDMVMTRKIEVVRPGEEFRLHIACVREGKPVRDGIIRVTDCSSEFVLRKIDDAHTSVDYQVRVDPGGHLPTWIITWAARSVPFKTLVSLEHHVKKTHARYASTARTWAAAK